MPLAARWATTSPPHTSPPRTSTSASIARGRAPTDPSVPPSTKTRATTTDRASANATQHRLAARDRTVETTTTRLTPGWSFQRRRSTAPALALRLIHLDPAGTLVREPRPGPVDHGLRSVLARRQERQVDRAPREPRRGPRERPTPAELHHGSLATDRRHRALVPVLERLGLLLLQGPRDRLAGVLPRLQRDRTELRKHALGLGVGDPRDVAHAVHLRVAGDREVGSDRDAVPVLQFEPEAGHERVGLQARSPDQRVGVQHGSGLQPHARRLDALDDLPEHDLDGALLERLRGVRLQTLLEHRQDGV